MHPREYAALREQSQRHSAIPDSCVNPVPATPARTPQSPRAPPPLDDDVLLTAAQTRARVGGVSAMCIWRWMRDARVRFPAPLKINKRSYWRLGDLRRWQAERTGSQT
jgi:predicted DNA-binding transcriptional regulator AlpA